MVTVVKNQPTSEAVRRTLKEEGRPVLVAFSGGKDAIACALALLEEDIPFELAHLYLIPGDTPGRTLDFVEEGLEYAEAKLGKKVRRYPHPSLYRMLNNLIFQPPERIADIVAADLPTIDYGLLWDLIRDDLGLERSTWVADGVRAADSPYRRAALVTHGVMKPSTRKVSPIHDWVKAEWTAILERHAWKLPPDYEMFGRSFDGVDRRFLEPMKRHRPKDYKRVLDWFPLAEMELLR